jgi:hypothetical protein
MSGGSRKFFNEDFKMSLTKMYKTNNGLVWKALRGTVKTTKRYICSGARTVEFTLMTVMLVGVGLLGYGQVTGDGPKLSFDAGELVFVDSQKEGRTVSVTILYNDEEVTYKKSNEFVGWQNSEIFEGLVPSEDFLDHCAAYAEFHDYNSEVWEDSNEVPNTRLVSLMPTLVWPSVVEAPLTEIPVTFEETENF